VAIVSDRAASGVTEGQANGAIVSGAGLHRRFGEGQAAVDALRGVSIDFPKGQMTTT
jgi:putative ABC transport system ATP-binding protein